MTGKIVSINVSDVKGKKKTPVQSAMLVQGSGIAGDAHAGSKRQVSLLAIESIEKMGGEFCAGAFAENITTSGIDLIKLPIGTELKIGNTAIIKITEIGKVCHTRCEIFKLHGRCVMPEEGVFAEVIADGEIRQGNSISLDFT